MEVIQKKPRLLFFQYKYDEALPAFLLIHKREHVKCLSEFFEVIVVQDDCDYDQVCDKYRPDLALFESGVPNPACRRVEITNARSCPQVPKLGFLHADGFCCARSGFLSDMDNWGIETFFAIATTAAEHTPEIADHLFIWPNFIDPDVYHDYGLWKSIPVLLTGNSNQMYPWRQKIAKLVSKRYPSLVCPHPGYAAHSLFYQQTTGGAPLIQVGEAYARMINASWFVPACGAVAKELIRKHLEVPGSKACLVAEKSPALEAAGFVDMKNCIFADESSILDKLELLFRNPQTLRAIINEGYRLVHSRHTLQNRDQILQWFNLRKILKSDQKIIQTGPFDSLRIVPQSAAVRNSHLFCGGLHLALLREGDKALWSGHYEEAEKLYIRCANYINYMPEPKLRLALCNLYKGNATKALSYVLDPIQFTLAEYKAKDPDPVEWAYFIVSLLCLGRINDAIKRAGEFALLRHPELDRVRWAVQLLSERSIICFRKSSNVTDRRFSIHRLPNRPLDEWIKQLCIMLSACGQQDMARILAAAHKPSTPGVQTQQSGRSSDGRHSVQRGMMGQKSRPRKRLLTIGRRDAYGLLTRRLFYLNIRSSFKLVLRNVLHGLEATFGYFLPYHLSAARDDEFFSAIQTIVRDEGIRTALIIGGAPRQVDTRSLLAGVLKSDRNVSVHCLGHARARSTCSALATTGTVTWYRLSRSNQREFWAQGDEIIRRIKLQNRIESFDVVLVHGSKTGELAANGPGLNLELHAAKWVLLENLSTEISFDIYNSLCRDPAYTVVACNVALRRGYAIFKNHSAGAASGIPSPGQENLTEMEA